LGSGCSAAILLVLEVPAVRCFGFWKPLTRMYRRLLEEHPAFVDRGAIRAGTEEVNLGRRPLEVWQRLDQVGPSLQGVSL
jgi:hypothetical protein